jgi:hypothetical protein
MEMLTLRILCDVFLRKHGLRTIWHLWNIIIRVCICQLKFLMVLFDHRFRFFLVSCLAIFRRPFSWGKCSPNDTLPCWSYFYILYIFRNFYTIWWWSRPNIKNIATLFTQIGLRIALNIDIYFNFLLYFLSILCRCFHIKYFIWT